MAVEAKIGVVTVTFNGAAYLEPFFRDCFRQTFGNFILYVVDNDSRDGALEIAKAQTDPRCVVIANGANLGVAEGNNIGIRRAMADSCTHVLLLNNDTEFPESLFKDLLSEQDALQAQLLVPKMFFFEPSNMVWCAGGRFSWSRGWDSIHVGEGEVDEGQFNVPQRIEYAPTCCMLARMDVFRTIGMMDERYFVYFDDTDFCLRARRAGVPMWYTPKTHLYHKVSSATGGYNTQVQSPFQIKVYSRNKVYYLLKNFGLFSWLWLTPFALQIVLSGFNRSAGGWAVAKQRFASFRNGFSLYRQSVASKG